MDTNPIDIANMRSRDTSSDPDDEYDPILPRNNSNRNQGITLGSEGGLGNGRTVGKYRVAFLAVAAAAALILSWSSQSSFVVERSGLRRSIGGENATKITGGGLLQGEETLLQKDKELKEREEELLQKEEAAKQKEEEERVKQKEEEEEDHAKEEAAKPKEEKRAQQQKEKRAKQKEEEERAKNQKKEEEGTIEDAAEHEEEQNEAEPTDENRETLQAERDELLRRYRVYAEPTDPNENKPQTDEEKEFVWDERKAWNELSPTQQRQIENYRKENALIFSPHPTHHGGTSFCAKFRKGIGNSTSPVFACQVDRDKVMPVPPECSVSGMDDHQQGVDPPFCYSHEEMLSRKHTPWFKNETEPFLRSIRKYFHFQTHEHRPYWHGSGRSHNQTDWEHPELVSVIITRDPLSRLLAGDGYLSKPQHYAGWNQGNLNRSRWWDLAVYNNEADTDNFFLRTMLSSGGPGRTPEQKAIRNHIEEGVERSTDEIMELFPTGLDETHYKAAKDLLDRFTFVLDIDCLTEGMDAVAKMLHIGELTPEKKSGGIYGRYHAKPKERINYEDVYDYLFVKNQWDIALYEYSKTISFIKCDSLQG